MTKMPLNWQTNYARHSTTADTSVMKPPIVTAVTTGSLYPLPTLRSIQRLHELGIQDIELTLQTNEFQLTFERNISIPILPELLSLIKDSKLRIYSVHAPMILAERCYNLWARLQLLIHSIEVCHKLGGGIVVIHPFHIFQIHENALDYFSGNHTSLKSILLPRIDDVLELARSANIKLAVENIQDWQDEPFFNTPDNVVRFLRDIDHPSLGVTLDLMHAQFANVVEAFIQSLSTKIVNIHAADFHPPTSRVPIGKGVIDWNRLTPMLKALPNLRQITVELSNPQLKELVTSVGMISASFS